MWITTAGREPLENLLPHMLKQENLWGSWNSCEHPTLFSLLCPEPHLGKKCVKILGVLKASRRQFPVSRLRSLTFSAT